jgi:hypothetical protein
MALLYANENFPLGVVQVLRELGHDVRFSGVTLFRGQAGIYHFAKQVVDAGLPP